MIYFILFLAHMSVSQAETHSNQPYIDRLKESLPATETISYTEKLKRELEPEQESHYIDRLKQTDPELMNKDQNSSTFLQKKQAELKEIDDNGNGSAIENLKSGQSELKLKRPGKIRYTAGIRVGLSNFYKFNASPSISSRGFYDIYPQKWSPNFTLTGEFKPITNDWLGHLSAIAGIGYAQFKGSGAFAAELSVPSSMGGGTFGSTSKTEMRFHIIPMTLGAKYQLSILKYITPYASLSGMNLLFFESRNDTKSGNRGRAFGYHANLGIGILMDWMSRRSSFDLYAENEVKHFYFTLEYGHSQTTTGEVEIQASGVYAGFAFDI